MANPWSTPLHGELFRQGLQGLNAAESLPCGVLFLQPFRRLTRYDQVKFASALICPALIGQFRPRTGNKRQVGGGLPLVERGHLVPASGQREARSPHLAKPMVQRELRKGLQRHK